MHFLNRWQFAFKSILYLGCCFGIAAAEIPRPELASSLAAPNTVEITVMNPDPAVPYELQSKSTLSAEPWNLREVGKPGQSKFSILSLDEGTEFFQVARSNDVDGDGIPNDEDDQPFRAVVPTQDVILDTDPGADPDDMSDIAIAHNLQKQGEIRLLAVIGAHKADTMAPILEVMNRYYDAGATPIAVAENGPVIADGYGVNIRDNYYNSTRSSRNVPEATYLYRKTLAERPDRSVTIVMVGPLRNLHNLWKSTGDSFSPLAGPELIAAKVKRIVVVAGVFPANPTGNEYNIGIDREAAEVLNLLTKDVRVSYMGIEQGNEIIIPTGAGVNRLEEFSPVRIAHNINSVINRPSWGGLGLLFAARGYFWRGSQYFRAVKGFATVVGTGGTIFTERTDYAGEYLVKTQADTFYINILDQLLCMGSHKLSRSGDTLSLSPSPYVTSLNWGDVGTGFRRSFKANEVDFTVSNQYLFRLLGLGMMFGKDKGILWAGDDILFAPIDAGLKRADAGRIKAVSNSAGALGDMEARRFQTGQGWVFNGEKTVVKNRDQSVSSSTALTGIEDLVINIEANKTYTVRAAMMIHEAGATAGLKMVVSGPSSARAVWFASQMKNGATTTESAEALAFEQEMTYNITAAGNKFYTLEGTIVNGPNPGPVQIKFAQRVSDAGAVTIRAASTLTLKQVD